MLIVVPEITHEFLIPLVWASRSLKYNFLILQIDNRLRKVSLLSDDSRKQKKTLTVIFWHSATKSGGIFMENAVTFTSIIIFF